VPATAASAYDTVTAASIRNLVVAMESYAAFDGNGSYTRVTKSALSSWGWSVGSSTAVQIVIEGDGASWRAVGQDTHAGSREYTYTSSTKVNGVSPGAVGVSSPQPVVAASTAGVEIRDVGQQVDIDQLAAALVAAGVTTQEVCAATVVYPGSHLAGSSLADHTVACETAAAVSGASMRSVLAAMMKAGGGAVVAFIAMEFVADGSKPASTPSWVGSPSLPTTPRPVPPSLPTNIWKLPRAAYGLAQQNGLDTQTARTVVEQCLKYVTNSLASSDPYKECSSTPIFMSGRSDVPEATQHDVEALATYPGWVQLNYRPAAENPSSRSWYASDPVCAAATSGQNCDEYPFFATEQGGGNALPRPSLKAIDGVQNQQQGRLYSSFLATCGVQSGDKFLAVPLPETQPALPTLAICNAG
jgi:hypothetical protein